MSRAYDNSIPNPPETIADYSKYTVDIYGNGLNGGRAARKVTSTDSSDSSYERYAHFSEYVGAGTGNGAVTAVSYAHGFAAIKQDWTTSTRKGQMGALNLTYRAGYHGSDKDQAMYGFPYNPSGDGCGAQGNGAYQRVRQTSSVSGGNAQFAYEFAAYSSAGVEMGISLGAAGGDVFAPMNDNIIYLGGGSNRWRTVFAGTGTINTSDEREKSWIGGSSDADKRAAKRIMAELGWYQWTASVAEQGEDNARRHFGLRAQAVARILMDEGVEVVQNIDFPRDVFVPEDQRPNFRTGFLCFDTWDEQWEDDFEEVDDVEKIDVVLTKREPTGEFDDDGKEIMRVTRVPEVIDNPVKRSIPTGTKTKIKDAGNIFSIRADQLALYMLAALAA